MAEPRGKPELQVFPSGMPENLPENRENLGFRDGSGPDQNPQPTPLPAPERRESPGFCPWQPALKGRGGRVGWSVEANGCHRWTGHVDPRGYGRVRVDGRLLQAHRVRYEREVGPIPEGMQLDHLCRNRACCNPAHLEPVTGLENIRRGAGYASHTHCKTGHPLSGDNLVAAQLKLGFRRCRICQSETDRRRRFASRARRREAARG